MSILKAVTTIGSWTALSRLLGMLRETLMSHFLGVSVVSDAFVIAFKFPNFFRRFFAEGAFHAAFVPQFSGKLSTEGIEASKKLSTDVFSAMAWFLCGFVIVVEILAPFLIPFIAPGFTNQPDRIDLAIRFTRITFPYIFFISLTALLAGVLSSVERFWVASAAPIILNITMIGALLMIPFSKTNPGILLSLSVLISGLFQFAWLYVACSKQKLSPKLIIPNLSPDVVKVLRLMIPGMVGAGAMQINMLIDLQLASFLPVGSLSYLYYADRLYQLPMSIFGVAVGTALLPSLSKLWRANDREEALKLQNKALFFVLFMNVPAAVGLIVLSQPIISLLFGHGAFTAADVSMTAPTLAAYALGLPAYVTSKVFATTFFAQNNTRTPVIVSLYVIAGNLILNLILMPFFQHVGLAIATSISAYLQAFALGYILYKKNLFGINFDFVKFSLKITSLSVLMGFLINYAMPVVLAKLQDVRFLIFLNTYDQFFNVALGICGGTAFYIVLCYVFGAHNIVKK